MESLIKVRSTINEMNDRFYNDYSKHYYVKYFNALNWNEEIKNDEKITFECLIRHSELEKNVIEGKTFTFKELDRKFDKLLDNSNK